MAFGVALCKFQLNSANDFLHSHFFATKSVHFLFSSHSRIHVAIAIPYLAKSIMQIRKTLHCVPWTFSSSCKLHIYSALCHTTATQLSNFTWLNTCSCQSTMTPKKKRCPTYLWLRWMPVIYVCRRKSHRDCSQTEFVCTFSIIPCVWMYFFL